MATTDDHVEQDARAIVLAILLGRPIRVIATPSHRDRVMERVREILSGRQFPAID